MGQDKSAHFQVGPPVELVNDEGQHGWGRFALQHGQVAGDAHLCVFCWVLQARQEDTHDLAWDFGGHAAQGCDGCQTAVDGLGCDGLFNDFLIAWESNDGIH